MAYPPALATPTYTDATPSAGTHALSHNELTAAITSIIAELGSDPAGAYDDLTTRLEQIPPDPVSKAYVDAQDAALPAALGVASVRNYGTVGDGVGDDRGAIQAAIDAVGDAGGGVVMFPIGTYRLGSPLAVRSNVTLRGAGPGSVITATTSIGNAISNPVGASVDNVAVEHLTFRGGAVLEGAYPRRARNTTPSFSSAIGLFGDNRDDAPGRPTITNVSIRSCRFINVAGLPVLLDGVRGSCLMTESYVDNCLDTGFIFCGSVRFTDNYVTRSADNGVSVSRRNELCVIADNVFVDGCYFGIWVAGFDAGAGLSHSGPALFSVTGNVVRNFGNGGLALKDAPKYGTITGNSFDLLVAGPLDAPNDADGHGILITGYPSGTIPAPTELASQLVITGNLLRRCARAGIGIRGSVDVLIADNLFVDFGKATYVGGAGKTAGDPIAAGEQLFNMGIYTADGASLSRIHVTDNIFVDTRATPLGNHAIHSSVSGSSGSTRRGNRAFRLRQPLNEGWSVGQADDTDLTFTIDTAAGALRDLAFRSGGVRRWDVRVDNTPETGGDAGSKFAIVARSDAGGFLRHVLVADRLGNINIGDSDAATKIGFFGNAPIARPAATDDLRAALVFYGLLTGGGATPLNLNGGQLTTGAAVINGDLAHQATGLVGFYGKAPVAKPAAIASPAAEVTSLKTAVDALRAALVAVGLTA